MAELSGAARNDLPDSAFAYIEPGGTKDSDGKTVPRSLRHFPHHRADGSPDAPHVRNALARIPQSDVSAAAKASALAHVRKHASAMNIGESALPDNYETREFADFELRQAGDSYPDPSEGEPPRVIDNGMPAIFGHAARFGQLSGDLGGFREKISREAFRKTLMEGDVRALWNHDSRLLLGRSKNGTLSLREDQQGLACRVQLPDTSYARDLAAIIKRGDLTGMSFGFRVIRDDWAVEGAENVRTLKEVELLDVSPVTYPAYAQTDVAMRSLERFLSTRAAPVQEGHAAGSPLFAASDEALEILRLRQRLNERLTKI